MDEDFTIEEIKMKINNLLWQVMPAKTTLEDAEKTACQWLRIYEQALKGGVE